MRAGACCLCSCRKCETWEEVAKKSRRLQRDHSPTPFGSSQWVGKADPALTLPFQEDLERVECNYSPHPPTPPPVKLQALEPPKARTLSPEVRPVQAQNTYYSQPPGSYHFASLCGCFLVCWVKLRFRSRLEFRVQGFSMCVWFEDLRVIPS